MSQRGLPPPKQRGMSPNNTHWLEIYRVHSRLRSLVRQHCMGEYNTCNSNNSSLSVAAQLNRMPLPPIEGLYATFHTFFRKHERATRCKQCHGRAMNRTMTYIKGVDELLVRARLFRFELEFQPVVCMAGVVVDFVGPRWYQ